MSDDEGKRREGKAIAERHAVDVGGVNDFGFEVAQGLSEVGDRDKARVPFSDQDGDDLARADVQDMDAVGGYRVEDRIDQSGAEFRHIPFGQCARVQEEGVRQAYSSRISIMPRLNSLLLGSKPSRIIRSRNFFAPIGLAGTRMPS